MLKETDKLAIQVLLAGLNAEQLQKVCDELTDDAFLRCTYTLGDCTITAQALVPLVQTERGHREVAESYADASSQIKNVDSLILHTSSRFMLDRMYTDLRALLAAPHVKMSAEHRTELSVLCCAVCVQAEDLTRKMAARRREKAEASRLLHISKGTK